VVTLHKLTHIQDNYIVTTEVFEGPLDLLLDLIEKAQLDITRLALAQVTDQYLAYIRSISGQDAADVSAFLVIAAKLIQIKSEALLPRPPEREVGEEDPGESLARQLIIYRKFKRTAEWLMQRTEAHLKTFLRLATAPKSTGKFNMTGVTLTDIVRAAVSAFNQKNGIPLINTVVALPKITIREKIRSILDGLRAKGKDSFRSLLNHSISRLDAIITFLAILELAKRGIIQVRQDSLFSDISIEALGDITQVDDFDLEFNE
jgi:segregation and condensation protein A